MKLFDFTAGACERPLPLLVHDHERKRYPEPDCTFVRTGLNASVAMPAFIFVGNHRKFTFARTIEDIAWTGISAKAATLTVLFVNYRRHLRSSNLKCQYRNAK